MIPNMHSSTTLTLSALMHLNKQRFTWVLIHNRLPFSDTNYDVPAVHCADFSGSSVQFHSCLMAPGLLMLCVLCALKYASTHTFGGQVGRILSLSFLMNHFGSACVQSAWLLCIRCCILLNRHHQFKEPQDQIAGNGSTSHPSSSLLCCQMHSSMGVRNVKGRPNRC